MTFVDAGANVGYYTAMAASIVRTGRVIAYEPNPYAYRRLDEWVQANGATNVTTVSAALGSKEGKINAYFPEFYTGTTSLVPALACRTGKETVIDVRTLDGEAERLGIRHIDVMKVDIEGYEPQLFQGASRLLREGRIGAMLCEFAAEWLAAGGSSIEELERIVTSQGFVQRAIYGSETAGDRWFAYASSDVARKPPSAAARRLRIARPR